MHVPVASLRTVTDEGQNLAALRLSKRTSVKPPSPAHCCASNVQSPRRPPLPSRLVYFQAAAQAAAPPGIDAYRETTCSCIPCILRERGAQRGDAQGVAATDRRGSAGAVGEIAMYVLRESNVEISATQ